MIDLLDYTTSPLNPFLKILTFLIFLSVALLYLDIRKNFGGHVKSFIDSLFLFAVFMAIGALLRYFGHGIEFGFTTGYSLKWLQSICYVIAAGFYILAAKKMLTLFQEGVE